MRIIPLAFCGRIVRRKQGVRSKVSGESLVHFASNSFLGGIFTEMTEKPIKQLYVKHLIAAFGSAQVGAVYTLVDMAIIG